MIRRVKTDLSTAIIEDRQNRELWMYASGNMPLYPDAPSEIVEHETEWRIRSLDSLFNDGIADALLNGWVVIPPIMARKRTEKDWMYPGSGRDVHERRVRVMRPEIMLGGYGTDAHAARAVYIVEPRIRPDGWGGEWVVYEPKYDDGSP